MLQRKPSMVLRYWSDCAGTEVDRFIRIFSDADSSHAII